MLNEYVARQRVADWIHVADQHRLLAENRPETRNWRHRRRRRRI
jgi:hypothetical protein